MAIPIRGILHGRRKVISLFHHSPRFGRHFSFQLSITIDIGKVIYIFARKLRYALVSRVITCSRRPAHTTHHHCDTRVLSHTRRTRHTERSGRGGSTGRRQLPKPQYAARRGPRRSGTLRDKIKYNSAAPDRHRRTGHN